MIRSLVQFRRHGERAVAGLDAAGSARHVAGTGSTFALAQEAIATGRPLAVLAAERAGDPVDLAGAELLLPVDGVPADVRGTSRIWRGNELVWDAPFLSGESNMCHTLANLEHHHFKHPQFGRPGLLHVHFFGTATLSFSQGIAPQPGDVFEIAADAFHLPLRSPLARGAERGTRKVTPL